MAGALSNICYTEKWETTHWSYTYPYKLGWLGSPCLSHSDKLIFEKRVKSRVSTPNGYLQTRGELFSFVVETYGVCWLYLTTVYLVVGTSGFKTCLRTFGSICLKLRINNKYESLIVKYIFLLCMITYLSLFLQNYYQIYICIYINFLIPFLIPPE